MPVQPTDVNPLPTETRIKITDGSGNGFAIDGGGNPIVLETPDVLPAPQTNIVEWEFNTTPGAVTINVEYDTNVVLSAAAFANPNITVQGVSGAWGLTDADSSDAFYPPDFVWDVSLTDTLNLDGSTVLNWYGTDGAGNQLTGGDAISWDAVTGAKPVTYDSLNGKIDFTGTASNVAGSWSNESFLQISRPISVRMIAFVLTGINSLNSDQHVILGGPAGEIWHEGLRIGNARQRFFESSWRNGVRTWWNNELTGSVGSELAEFGSAGRDRYFRNDTGQSYVAGDPLIIFYDLGTLLPGLTYLGANIESIASQTATRGGNYSITKIAVWGEVPSDDYLISAGALFAWDEFNRDNSRSILLFDTGEGDTGSPANPYISAPRGGSGVPTVTVSAPATSVSLTNIPEVGTDVYIYDGANFDNQIASLTTTLTEHSIPYEAATAQIRVQIIFPAGTLQELDPLIFDVGNIPINVDAIADDERNYRNPS